MTQHHAVPLLEHEAAAGEGTDWRPQRLAGALHVLIVVDAEDEAERMIAPLRASGLDPLARRVNSAASMRAALRRDRWDIVLCDGGLASFDASDALELIGAMGSTIPVVVVTGSIGEEKAAELMRAGAADVVLKQNIGSRLAPTVRRELAAAQGRRAAAENDQRFRDVAEVSADWIWETDARHHFTLFIGERLDPEIQLDTVLGKTRWEVAGGDPEHDELWRRHRADLDARRPFRGFRYALSWGSGERHLSVSGKPVFDGAGRFTGYRGTAIDETATVEAQHRAVEAEALLRDAIDSISEGFVIYDSDDRLVLCNERYRRLYPESADRMLPGISFEDILRGGLANGQYADAIGREEEWLAERMRLHRDVSAAVEQRLPDNRWMLVTERRMRNGWIAGLRIDISALKAAQQALLESEQMARRIVETALDGFVQVSETGQVLEWNPQAEAIFGWPRQDVLGHSLESLIMPAGTPARDRRRLVELLTVAEAPAHGSRTELPARHRDGHEITVELAMTLSRRRSGTVFNAFVRDVTRKAAAEEQLRQAQKMEAVGQLTGGVAHDFNNILTVITGTVGILAEGVAQNATLSSIARMIDDAATRGAELTRHLLAFARRQPLQPRDVDVNALVVETAKLLRPALGEDVEIESVLDGTVWPALIDPSQLATALLNLAINARDAMPDGGKLTIETGKVILDDTYAAAHSEVAPGPYVLIAVSDTGAGIPADLLDKVFEPFFTTKDVGKGTGLGLSMVYGFVKQSGGHLKIYSEVGHGTCVRIYLPRASELSEPVAVAAAAPPTAVGHECILVVEDDELVRNYVKAQLASLGYQTLIAGNAAEALALIDQGASVDLLFTDVIMPGTMNGRHLADELVRRRPATRVLFTSGYTENAIMHHGRLDPGVLLLPKPYRKVDLARMIRTALDTPQGEKKK